MEQMAQAFEDDDDAFWQRLVIPEEDRLRIGQIATGGYRWFRSRNVICLEKYRRLPTGEDEDEDRH
jgi:hypothetical protein